MRIGKHAADGQMIEFVWGELGDAPAAVENERRSEQFYAAFVLLATSLDPSRSASFFASSLRPE